MTRCIAQWCGHRRRDPQSKVAARREPVAATFPVTHGRCVSSRIQTITTTPARSPGMQKPSRSPSARGRNHPIAARATTEWPRSSTASTTVLLIASPKTPTLQVARAPVEDRRAEHVVEDLVARLPVAAGNRDGLRRCACRCRRAPEPRLDERAAQAASSGSGYASAVGRRPRVGDLHSRGADG